MPAVPSDEPTPAAASRPSRFLSISCQAGAEEAVFARLPAVLPTAARAAWRRGIITVRLPDNAALSEDFLTDELSERLLFARVISSSYGQVAGGSLTELATATLALAPGPWQRVHVWHRDAASPRRRPADASPSAVDLQTEILRRAGLAADDGIRSDASVAGTIAERGDRILDVVIDSPQRAWVGWHRADRPASCWPGGIYPHELPSSAVSRAWLKLDEAIATFELPLVAGQRACELGSAPGGASQRLLAAGLRVVGVDPAEADPLVMEHARYEHWRMRARDIRLRAFRGFDWLVTDMNIDPSSTVEALERLVTAPGVRLRGIIATLKLPTWSRAAEISAWIERFHGWGYTTRCRQLSHGGREVCVAAVAGS
jgi:23S rRNA (cytidine2498-2'-O)-methyltransferase